MGLFDSIQSLFGGAAGDVLGGIPGLDGIQEQVSGATEAVASVTDGATEAIAPVIEQGQTAVEDITNNLGL